MSRSESQALALVDEAVGSGIFSDREAEMWRSAVKDPCGCAEGLAAGVLTSVGASAARHGSLAEVVFSGTAGFVVGAVAGKVYSVAKGLRLVRHQRVELQRRIDDLTSRSEHVPAPAGPASRRTP